MYLYLLRCGWCQLKKARLSLADSRQDRGQGETLCGVGGAELGAVCGAVVLRVLDLSCSSQLLRQHPTVRLARHCEVFGLGILGEPFSTSGLKLSRARGIRACRNLKLSTCPESQKPSAQRPRTLVYLDLVFQLGLPSHRSRLLDNTTSSSRLRVGGLGLGI